MKLIHFNEAKIFIMSCLLTFLHFNSSMVGLKLSFLSRYLFFSSLSRFKSSIEFSEKKENRFYTIECHWFPRYLKLNHIFLNLCTSYDNSARWSSLPYFWEYFFLLVPLVKVLETVDESIWHQWQNDQLCGLHPKPKSVRNTLKQILISRDKYYLAH